MDTFAGGRPEEPPVGSGKEFRKEVQERGAGKTAQLLERHFDTAFAAPDGIKKLRELILTLAMQGKLVAQDPNDPPARKLLKEIEAEKKRGGTRRREDAKGISLEEMPYELPVGWEWVRLGQVVDILDNLRKPVTKQDRESGPYPYYGASGIVDYVSNYLFDEPLVLVGEDGAKWGCGENTAFSISGKTWVNNHAHVLRPIRTAIIDQFVIYSLVSQDLKPFITGMTVPKLNQARLVSIILPLPPLPEQQRIVAKIDQLMARCDELEKLRAERERKRLAVHTTAIRQLLAEAPSSSFAPSRLRVSPFLFTHFDELYSVKENVAELRKAILQLAVMGKLVPQNPNDPPASQLLKEIEVEKKRLVKAGKIKQPKPLPEIKPDEVPYRLPVGWEWVRLSDVSTKIHYGYTASANHDLQDVRLLRITDIQDNRVEWASVPGCDAQLDDITQYLLADNDILIARTGGTVGKSYLVQGIDVNAVFASYLIRVVPSAHIDVRYLKYFAEGPLYWKQLYAACSGTGQPNVNGTSLSELLLTLPPLPEQHRIVAKIDQLMAHCDELEKQIEAATGQQTVLLNAVMSNV